MKVKTRLAIIGGKLTKRVLKIAGRSATHFPGVVAAKIDKELINNIKKPENIIAITGTNGKTTTSNIISDTLENMKKTYSSNKLGSNLYDGIAAELLSNYKFFNKKNIDFGVYEVDELWINKVIPQLTPKTLTVTNLTQDSFERNSSVYYVFDKIQEGISKGIKLILNADDAISAYLGGSNQNEIEKVYFSVENIFNEESSSDSISEDLVYNSSYTDKVQWIYRRYGHIGKYDSHGFKNPASKYTVIGYNKDENTIDILESEKKLVLPLIDSSIESIYNQIAAYATLRENGLSYELIAEAMKYVKLEGTRLDIERVKNKNIIRKVSKRNNPVALSRIVKEISKNSKNPTIILLFDYLGYPTMPVKTPSWYSSVDFHLLKENTKAFYIKALEANEIKLSMVLQGFDEKKIVIAQSIEEIAHFIDYDVDEDIYILHDFLKEDFAQALKLKSLIKEKVEKEV